jgi:hypothetical protein
MLMRWASVFVLAVIVWPWSAPEQSGRRWLADPELLTTDEQGRQYPHEIVDMDLVNKTAGWAVTRRDLLRFDGRFLHNDQVRTAKGFPAAIDMVSPTSGWVVGTSNLDEYFRSLVPANVYMLRYTGNHRWEDASQVVHKDGSVGPFPGGLTDVVAHADGTAWAVGAWRETQSRDGRERPILLHFDGKDWRDMTPNTWRYGRIDSISMVGPAEGWVAGTLGLPTGQGLDKVRGLIGHLSHGSWSEEALPTFSPPFQIGGVERIIMRDATEGWAVFHPYLVASCAQTGLLHYAGGRWIDASSVVPIQQYIAGMGLIPGTGRGWVSMRWACASPTPWQTGQRMRFDNGTLTPDPGGATLAPAVYALLDDDVQWAAAGGALMRFSDERLPTERQPARRGNGRYFPATGQYVDGPFLQYYEAHGLNLGDGGVSERESLALFGYPLSAPFQEANPETGNLALVQYFERARMEYHPENSEPYKTLLGRLGYRLDYQQPQRQPGCETFPQTRYDLCEPFRAFWHANGGLPVFGLPVTAADNEMSPADYQSYRMQYFERERLEYHPERKGTVYEVQLGRLGAENLRARGYLENN